MSAIDRLLNSSPFSFTPENKKLFMSSLQECALAHYQGHDYFRHCWELEGLHPEMIDGFFDITKLPFMMVNLFKHQDMVTGHREDIVLTLGSSGTSGQRSLMNLNEESLLRVKTLAQSIYRDLGITSDKKYNYLCFTYDPVVANDLGTAFTDELLTSFTDKAEVFYCFQHNGKEFVFEKEKTVEKLKEFEQSSFSTRILGFPAHLYELIHEYDLQLNLGADSWLQTGGGWKGKADQEIEKSAFRAFISKRLGIPQANIRDLFGMVEHGIPYVDDEKGRLRVPNFARVIIRDPKTLRPLNYGEKGLIQFICSYNTSYPAMSLLTTDWGVLTNSDDDRGDTLTILGRAGVIKQKGCAIKASELLGKREIDA